MRTNIPVNLLLTISQNKADAERQRHLWKALTPDVLSKLDRVIIRAIDDGSTEDDDGLSGAGLAALAHWHRQIRQRGVLTIHMEPLFVPHGETRPVRPWHRFGALLEGAIHRVRGNARRIQDQIAFDVGVGLDLEPTSTNPYRAHRYVQLGGDREAEGVAFLRARHEDAVAAREWTGGIDWVAPIGFSSMRVKAKLYAALSTIGHVGMSWQYDSARSPHAAKWQKALNYWPGVIGEVDPWHSLGIAVGPGYLWGPRDWIPAIDWTAWATYEEPSIGLLPIHSVTLFAENDHLPGLLEPMVAGLPGSGEPWPQLSEPGALYDLGA